MAKKTPLSEVSVGEYETVHFDAADGLRITADYYQNADPTGFALLCHRSHFNRGEYRETAPKLVQLGFSCLAIDQRSGMNVLGVINETSSLAKSKKLKTGYLEARPDIEAAMQYAFELNANQPIVFIGSSYTGSLGLLMAKSRPEVEKIVAFSPSECLKKINLAEAISDLNTPTYVTSAKKEIDETTELLRNVDASIFQHFKPTSEGFHGSRILWESVDGHAEHWDQLSRFLAT